MDVASLGFRTDLALLERSGSTIDDRGDHLVITTPSNPGFYWGNFLLLDQVPAAERVGDGSSGSSPPSPRRGTGRSGSTTRTAPSPTSRRLPGTASRSRRPS